jgi:NADPH-dependent 2,4-dienoyl-CoA reductase/sulfur reductase-like enzyme
MPLLVGRCALQRWVLGWQPGNVTRARWNIPLDSNTHKQGRVAGENAVGGRREFDGTLDPQVVKVFDLAIARTGLRCFDVAQAHARPPHQRAGYWDHKMYYPGEHELRIRLTGERR